VNQVVGVVFAYISLLKTHGAQQWIHEEMSTVADCNFRFLSKRNPIDYTCSLAERMQIYPIQHVLSGPYKVYEYDPVLIEDFLQYLSPQNVIVIVSSKSFEGTMDSKEFWYGTEYTMESLTEELCNKWQNDTADPDIICDLDFPEKNEMIPSDFALYRDSDALPDEPLLLLDTDRCRLWYKPDNVFEMPKVNIMAMLQTSVVSESPDTAVLSLLWVQVIQEQLTEFSYLASMAGLHCSVANARQGIQLSVSGFSHKAHILHRRLVYIMRSSAESLDAELFIRVSATTSS